MEFSFSLPDQTDKSNKNGNKRFCLHARTVAQVNAAEDAGVMSATRVLFKLLVVHLSHWDVHFRR